jgi:hypothetical protein
MQDLSKSVLRVPDHGAKLTVDQLARLAALPRVAGE